MFWSLQLCGWLAFGVSMFVATAVYLPPAVAAFEKGVFTLLGVLFTLPLRAIYRPLYRRNIGFPKTIAIGVACAYLGGMLWTVAFHLAINSLNSLTRGQPFSVGSWQRLLDGGLYHAFVLLAWSVLYFGIKHYRDLQEQTARALRAEALAQQAQLQALRYQLNPHFLFNTLNAISTLVARHENADANRMIARLSEFLRLTLSGAGAAEVPLAAEIDFVKRYLEIEQVRLADRLNVRFDVAHDALAVPVPNLILQPLVENAIRHGIAPRESGGRLEIEARTAGGMLHLTIRNDGPNPAGDLASLSQGVGLSNTRARLDQLYGASHRFELQAAEGGGLAVVIGLPICHHANHQNGNDRPSPPTPV